MCCRTAFSMGKVWFCGQIFSSPFPCPRGYVTQYKTVGGRRWIAHCPPTLWSFFWMASSDPDDKPGGRRLPAAASGPLADDGQEPCHSRPHRQERAKVFIPSILGCTEGFKQSSELIQVVFLKSHWATILKSHWEAAVRKPLWWFHLSLSFSSTLCK